MANWDWSGAEQEIRRAIALNPNNADAHDNLCFYLDVRGRLDEGWTECQIAQGLDPNSNHLSVALERRGRYNHAIDLLLRWAQSNPADGFLHYYLYRDFALEERYKESAHELEQSLTLMGYSGIAADVHRAFATSGYPGALRAWAKALENLHATNQVFLPRLVAEVYAQLGDKDRAFYWLEQGYAQKDRIGYFGGIAWIPIEHDLDPLRSDPRYADLLRRIGLPQ